MDLDVSSSLPASASAPISLDSTLSTVHFDPETEAAPLPDDPTLEACKRDLEAVLAALDS